MSRKQTATGAARHAGVLKTVAGIAATAVAGIAITSSGVYALLKAEAFNSTAEQVSAGTLLLTLGSSGSSVGFSQAIANLAPGDVATRFVQVANTGTLDGANLNLALSDQSTVTALTTDAVKGLQVTVQSCTVAWTWTPSGTPACSGTAGAAIAQPAATFKATAQTLAPTFAAGGTQYYKVSLGLPASISEVSTNGVVAPGSVQGLSSSLRWTFTMDQRASVSLNS
ncbi:TasA family protein [Kineococcus endophyticus]|uniref:TasA family protein n=1 Tax=Kineococcus endophyticus TaxID=1181883 RepID=A0ABV3P3W8_9ACTN